jgi:SET domain-containing protein
MELDQYGGSALFPGAAIMEHNCFPNCSFATASEGDAKHSVMMTALRQVNAGEIITVNSATCQ